MYTSSGQSLPGTPSISHPGQFCVCYVAFLHPLLFPLPGLPTHPSLPTPTLASASPTKSHICTCLPGCMPDLPCLPTHLHLHLQLPACHPYLRCAYLVTPSPACLPACVANLQAYQQIPLQRKQGVSSPPPEHPGMSAPASAPAAGLSASRHAPSAPPQAAELCLGIPLPHSAAATQGMAGSGGRSSGKRGWEAGWRRGGGCSRTLYRRHSVCQC